MTDYLDRRLDPGDSRIASVLDELCGTGFPLLELGEVHGASCRFVGADLWKAGMGPGLAECSRVARPGARIDAIARRDGELRLTIPMLYREGRRR